MPDHEPFDGTVPMIMRGSSYLAPRVWVVFRPGDHISRRFATWREAMNYATKENDDD